MNNLQTQLLKDTRNSFKLDGIDKEGLFMSLVREFWDFMKVRKKFWLAPILIVLVILSAFIILAASSPVAAPFIYTLF